jgi:hypothetical protein
VKHMLAIDWKFWKSYLLASSAKYITIRMLGRVAGMFFDRSMNCLLVVVINFVYLLCSVS